MDDRIKESISALIDGEANELELQRILSHDDQEGVHDVWQSYHHIRDVLSHDSEEFAHIDISKAVSQAVELEEHELVETSFSDEVRSIGKRHSEGASNDADQLSHTTAIHQLDNKPIYRMRNVFAVAACMAFAFFFALKGTLDQNTFDNGAPSLAALDQSQTNENILEVGDENLPGHRQPKMIVEISEEHAKYFNQYLLRHAEHSVRGAQSGLMPLARVASVNSVGI